MTTFESLFPLKGTVTPEIIELCDDGHPFYCKGAMTLRLALGEHVGLLIHTLSFGITKGTNEVWVDERQKEAVAYDIHTLEDVNFDKLDKPTEVTFIVKLKEVDKVAKVYLKSTGTNKRAYKSRKKEMLDKLILI